jgi:cytochrome P450
MKPAAGCHWQLAEELRETSPLYFNTFAQGYWVLILAGLDTTRAKLGYMFKHLADHPEHPEHRRMLIDRPGLIPSAVEEVLRYYAIIFETGARSRATSSSTARA